MQSSAGALQGSRQGTTDMSQPHTPQQEVMISLNECQQVCFATDKTSGGCECQVSVCMCVMINGDRVQRVWDLFNCTTDGCKACCGSRLKGDWPSTRNWQAEWCQSPNRPLYGVLGLFSLLLQSLVLVSIACLEEKRWSFQDILFTGLFAGKLVVSITTRQGHMHSSFRSTNLIHLPWPNPTLSG